jgi:2-iminobutanoate/2-iminopropanoate deaminase
MKLRTLLLRQDINLYKERNVVKMAEKIYTASAPDAIGPYSQAIKVQGLVFTSGQIAINPESGSVEAQTIEGQTEQVMKNLGEVLKAAGSSYDKAVKTVCFLKNMSDFAVFNEIYGKYFTSKPARSCVAVKELPKDVLVEVEVIAEA